VVQVLLFKYFHKLKYMLMLFEMETLVKLFYLFKLFVNSILIS